MILIVTQKHAKKQSFFIPNKWATNKFQMVFAGVWKSLTLTDTGAKSPTPFTQSNVLQTGQTGHAPFLSRDMGVCFELICVKH